MKAAVRCQQQGIYESETQESVATLYTVCRQVLKYMYSACHTVLLAIVHYQRVQRGTALTPYSALHVHVNMRIIYLHA